MSPGYINIDRAMTTISHPTLTTLTKKCDHNGKRVDMYLDQRHRPNAVIAQAIRVISGH